MKKQEKKEIMKRTSCDLDVAKGRIYSAVGVLESSGLGSDAEKLMSIIYKLEAIQNKYNY
jgi:hypothetical protein